MSERKVYCNDECMFLNKRPTMEKWEKKYELPLYTEWGKI